MIIRKNTPYGLKSYYMEDYMFLQIKISLNPNICSS